ncbi:MAG TPA: VWA domain-containing protein [Firmicutes bacterium]|nr:VWA domain-containing protein [Bacillota bacterium]
MLSWGEPRAFWFAVVIIPIIFFYFLRMRFRRQPVSSIYIWSRLQMTSRGGRKLRYWSVLLLLIQVLAATAGVVTLARPAWVAQRLEQPGIVYILDVSASMNAQDVEGGRLAQAKSILEERVGELSADTPVVIYLAGAETTQLCPPSTVHQALLSALKAVECTYGSFDEEEAAQVLQAWLATEHRPWQGCLLTDGGLDLQGKKLSAVFNGLLEVVTVGAHGENLGLTGLRVLPHNQYRFSVENGYPAEQEIKLCLSWEGEPLSRQVLKVPPGLSLYTLSIDGANASASVGLGDSRIKPGAYSLVLEENTDIFPVDDKTYFAVNQGRAVRILLAGRGNPFFKAALSAPGLEVLEVPALEDDSNYSEWDLVIADCVEIPAGVRTNLLTFGALSPGSPVAFGPEVRGELSQVDSTHPLLRFVDWRGTRVNAGRSLLLTEGNVQILATVGGEPVIAAWEAEDRHVVVCSVTFFHSDLGLSAAFPIFLQNMLKWCVPQMGNALAYTLVSGEARIYAEPGSWQTPEEADFRIDRTGRYLTIVPDRPGVYHWKKADGSEIVFAITLDQSELSLVPRVLPLKVSGTQLGIKLSKERVSLARWSLLILLTALCLEWVFWRGGWSLRTVKKQ